MKLWFSLNQSLEPSKICGGSRVWLKIVCLEPVWKTKKESGSLWKGSEWNLTDITQMWKTNQRIESKWWELKASHDTRKNRWQKCSQCDLENVSSNNQSFDLVQVLWFFDDDLQKEILTLMKGNEPEISEYSCQGYVVII